MARNILLLSIGRKVIFGIGRSLLKLTLLFAVFLGSFSGLFFAWRESPYLLMSEINDVTARGNRGFFVAFKAGAEFGEEEVRILPYGTLPEFPREDIRTFRLTDGEFDLDTPAGDSASIRSETNNKNIQTTTVRVVGDTPWASVSVYEVHGEEIVPLKLGQAGFGLLFAAFIFALFLVFVAQQPAALIAEMVFPRDT